MNYGALGWLHIGSALIALSLGALLVVRPKGTSIHRLTGLAYVNAMILLNASALMIYDMTGHFGPFHFGALFSLACVGIGSAAAILKPSGWLKRHYRWMGWSYFGLLAATFAEAMVRIPAFQARTAARGFEVALIATLVFSIGGSFFMRWLGRALNRFHAATSMPASPADRLS